MTPDSPRLTQLAAFREQMTALKATGQRVGFVPTMGALHEGHLSLIETARAYADVVAVSIFVNPKQFDRDDDLKAYPRHLEADIKLLSEAGAELLFAPLVDDMYPTGFQTTVSVGDISKGLCGGARPGHFDGVATVVCKLLLAGLPDVAVFGEKDFQQLMVIRRMVEDLSLPVEIVGAPIVRAADGLALSSRNVNLSADERALAPQLYLLLQNTAAALRRGAPAGPLLQEAMAQLESHGFQVDYCELRDGETLTPLDRVDPARPARLLAAAWLGAIRLIDNVAV